MPLAVRKLVIWRIVAAVELSQVLPAILELVVAHQLVAAVVRVPVVRGTVAPAV